MGSPQSPSQLLERKIAALQGWAVGLGVAVLVTATGFFTFGVHQIHERASERADNRLFFCQQIEALKAGEREAARESFRDLDKNLALLGIKRTDEIVVAARKARDEKLARYRPVNCELVARGIIPSTEE